MILAIVIISLAVCLGLSTYSANQNAAKQATALAARSASSSSIVTIRRTSLAYGIKVAEWLNGGATKREVQLAETTLVQQLLRTDANRISFASRTAPEYRQTLNSLIAVVAKSPEGLLPASQRQATSAEVRPLVSVLLDDSRRLAAAYQKSLDAAIYASLRARAHEASVNFWLLYSLIAISSLFLILMALAIRKGYRRARERIRLETLEVVRARGDLLKVSSELQAVREAEAIEINRVEQLREGARELSIALRGLKDSQVTAQHFCASVSGLFSMDYVGLQIIGDDRVPDIEAFWGRDETTVSRVASPENLEAFKEVIPHLWATSTLLVVDDAMSFSESHAPLGPSVRTIYTIAQRANLQSFVLGPIGEGEKAFGVIVLGMHSQGQPWDDVQTYILQFLTTHLAYSLVEGQLIAAQRVVERLEELNEAKNEFIATVNHELRTPLTSIIGYLDLVRITAGQSLDDKASKLLDVVDRNALTLLELIEDTLSISRLDSSVPQAPHESVDVAECIEWCRYALAPKARERNISISLICHKDSANLHDSEFFISGYAGQISQVFMNLLSNAIKFSAKDSDVTIRVSRAMNLEAKPVVRVEVQDSGIGIAQEDLPNLFARFFRGKNAMELNLPGTGLGLAIVEKIIKLHNGEIEVRSELGKGTTMVVILPVALATDSVPEPSTHVQEDLPEVEKFVMERREGVLRRAIQTLEHASIAQLSPLAHELHGALSLYSMDVEGNLLRNFSTWLEATPRLESDQIDHQRGALVIALRRRLGNTPFEGTTS